jgi:hypothetical protein
MTRLYVRLPTSDFESFTRWAREELRHPSDHAQWLLRQAIRTHVGQTDEMAGQEAGAQRTAKGQADQKVNCA